MTWRWIEPLDWSFMHGSWVVSSVVPKHWAMKDGLEMKAIELQETRYGNAQPKWVYVGDDPNKRKFDFYKFNLILLYSVCSDVKYLLNIFKYFVALEYFGQPKNIFNRPVNCFLRSKTISIHYSSLKILPSGKCSQHDSMASNKLPTNV